MRELRGKVTRVIFHVEYPDGTQKVYDYSTRDRLNAVILSDEYANDEMKQLLNVSSEDWTKNPAMIIVDGEKLIPNCDYPDCQNA